MQGFAPTAFVFNCPARGALIDFGLGRLSEREHETVSSHVSQCEECSGVLQEIQELPDPDSDLDRVRRCFEVGSPGIDAACERMIAMAMRDGVETATGPPRLATRGDLVDRWIGQYEVMGQLGQGGMGVVYKARQAPLERLVALKMISGGRHSTSAAIARFLREGRALGRLHHPNVVQIHELGEADGLPYYSMELVEGGSLKDRSRLGPIEPKEAAELVSRLATAVAYAHEEGVIHRDLKPANILFARDGTPKIADFGLAKLLDLDPDGEPATCATETGAVMGTLWYMAPEQAEGRPGDVGAAADIYALGGILYELLAGRPPFLAGTRDEILKLLRSAEVVPPSRHRPGLPRGIEAVCLKCLEKRPSRRYPSARALADDLDRWLRDEAPRGVPRWPARLARKARRHLTGLASASILAAAGLVWNLNSPDRALASIEGSLARGRAVTLVGPTGRPAWSHWPTEPPRGRIELGDDATLSVESWSMALLELVPDTPKRGFRLSAQIRHESSHSIMGNVGLYFSRKTYRHRGNNVHCFIDVSFNDIWAKADRWKDFPDRFQKLRGGNLVGLHARLLGGDPRRPSIDALGYILPPESPWPQFNVNASMKRWHDLEVIVTPERVAVRWDGQLSHTRASVVSQRFEVTIGSSIPPGGEPLPRGTRPEFDGRGGLGLYVRNGVASFRSVTLTPF